MVLFIPASLFPAFHLGNTTAPGDKAACRAVEYRLVQLHCKMNQTITQFRYIKIQPKTIDLNTRLRGINYRDRGVYSPVP